MKAQGEFLKKETNKKVFGRFRPIKELGIARAMHEIQRTSKGSLEAADTSDEISSLADANELYTNGRFCFEIYNQFYKFRPFEMMIPPLYPVQLYIDDDIMEEKRSALSSCGSILDTSDELQISNEDCLYDALSEIFSSRKVRYIVMRLMGKD